MSLMPPNPVKPPRNRLSRAVAVAIAVLALAWAAVAEAQQPKVLLPTPPAPRTAATPQAAPAPQPAPAAQQRPAVTPPAAPPAAAAETPRPDVPPVAHNGDIIGELRHTVTWHSDNLLDIARAENLGLIEILAANPGVDPWLPGAGTKILLPTAHILPSGPREGIVINLAELRLYYYDPRRGPMTFPIGVGREGFGTPIGTTRVTRKAADPTWYPTPGKRADDPTLPAVVPPGPDNPLGEFALYLGWPTYLIHGTNKPDGVGRRVSRGCIRMYPEDIAFLYREVPVGTPVRTILEPVKLGRSKEGHLYIEVHPSLEQIDQLELEKVAKPDPLPDQTDRILMFAGDDYQRLDWTAIDAALKARQGIPIRITRSPPA